METEFRQRELFNINLGDREQRDKLEYISATINISSKEISEQSRRIRGLLQHDGDTGSRRKGQADRVTFTSTTVVPVITTIFKHPARRPDRRPARVMSSPAILTTAPPAASSSSSPAPASTSKPPHSENQESPQTDHQGGRERLHRVQEHLRQQQLGHHHPPQQLQLQTGGSVAGAWPWRERSTSTTSGRPSREPEARLSSSTTRKEDQS
jgi:hypothetical protein